MGSIENSVLNITPELIHNVRKIYDLDDPKRLEESIKILEDWIQKQPHIIKKDFNKRFLETSIITCKGSLEKAKRQIDLLCTMKTMMPKFFAKYNLKTDLDNILKKVWIIPLPVMTEDHCRLVLVKTFDNELSPEEILQFFQYILILYEYDRANDYCEKFAIIVDYRDVNMYNLLARITTPDVQPFINILINGYGGRMKNLHIVTESKAVEFLVAALRQFVSEKLGKRILVHKTLEDMYQVVPQDLMPEEYGGKTKSYHKIQAEVVDELASEKHVEYVKVMFNACTDESKRHTGKFNEEYMGMPGSFRNLTVD